ncbi:MAG: hypothetical protein AB7I27_16180 [Bacteriovoracaceae bacterium]
MLPIIYLILITLLVYWIESPALMQSNLLIIRPHPGELLEAWLKKFHWGNKSQIGEKVVLPRYKFYSEVIEVLLNLARRMGGNYQEALLFLREGLMADRQFEKKLKEIILGAWFQMVLMMGLTWAFIIGSLSIVEINVAPFKLVGILLWQIIGLACLPILIKVFREKFFSDIGKIWKVLFILKSLAKVPLSRSEVLNMAGVSELKQIKQSNLFPIVNKLKEICQRALQIGGSYENEVNYLMEELRFQEKWHFELFEKRLLVVKIALLAVFFLPSYLAFIFLLLSDLMTLM